MTLEELELQVQKNTTAIADLTAALNNYVLQSQLQSLTTRVDSAENSLQTLRSMVQVMQTSIGLVNQLSKLIDTNIGTDLVKNDILVYDGDRWTNIQPSELILGSTGGSYTLEGLQDVSITSKQHGQALTYDSSLGKWVNSTVSSGGGGGAGGFDEAGMWTALSGSAEGRSIKPEFINGQALDLTGLTVNGNSIQFVNGSNTVSVTSSGLTATGEITAYS